MTAELRWQRVLDAAFAQGLLGHRRIHAVSHHWYTVALAFLAAAAIAVPILVVLSMLVSSVTFGTRPYLGVGVLLIGATLALLRSGRPWPLLIELLLPILMAAGVLSCAQALLAETPVALSLLAITALCLMLAWMTPLPWFQALLSCVAGLLLIHAISIAEWRFTPQLPWLYGLWSSLLLLVMPATALLGLAWQRRAVRHARWVFANRFEGPMRGWFIAAVMTLAAGSGPSVFAAGIFVGGAFAPSFAAGVGNWQRHVLWWPPTWFALVTLWLGWRAARLRWPWLACKPVTALVILGSLIAWMLQPALAPALALSLVAVAAGRWSLAIPGFAGCLWILATLLVLLPLSLGYKAAVLTALGMVFACIGGRPDISWARLRAQSRAIVRRTRRDSRWSAYLLAGAALATLVYLHLGAGLL